jgi:heme exporter protein C
MNRGSRTTYLLLAVTAPLMVGALYLIFHYAPDELVMGAVQRVFYFHVPAAMVAFTSTFVMLAGSVGFLWTARRGFDHLALAATELAFVFCTLVLVTGPIWAKPAWGHGGRRRRTTTLVPWPAGGVAHGARPGSHAAGARFGAVRCVGPRSHPRHLQWRTGWQHPVVWPGRDGARSPHADGVPAPWAPSSLYAAGAAAAWPSSKTGVRDLDERLA